MAKEIVQYEAVKETYRSHFNKIDKMIKKSISK